MPRPGLSKRQCRRRWEDVYWANVHVNAVRRRQRAWKRYEKALDAVFEEYRGIVEAEHQLCRSLAFTDLTCIASKPKAVRLGLLKPCHHPQNVF